MNTERFKLKRKLGEGSFAVVIQAYDTQRKTDVAIKCIKDKFKSLEDALHDPEIQIFRCLSKHPNIVNLLEVLYLPEEGKLSLVFEYMDWSLYDFLMESPKYASLTNSDFKFIFYQITNGISHLHAQGIFHRDIKPENILIDSKTLQVKIADFGCCKGIYDSNDLTMYISTRWYRPPECAILCGYYGKSMDIWATACVFFEMLTSEPMFPGKSEVDQVSVINSIIGSPSQELLSFYFKYDFNENVDFRYQEGFGIEKYLLMYHPYFGKFEHQLINLLKEMLHHDPKLRISAEDVLRNPFFKGLNVTSKYSQFCKKDEVTRANELFHKLINRQESDKEQTLNVIRNSIMILKNSSASSMEKHLLEEKVLRKMSKQKTINQKIQIRKYFRQIGDDVLELGKLNAQTGFFGNLIKQELDSNGLRKKVKRKRPLLRKKNRKKKKFKMKSEEQEHNVNDQIFQSKVVNNLNKFQTLKKPKNSHFPSISNSKNFSNFNLSSKNDSLDQILNISKFDIEPTQVINSIESSFQKPPKMKKSAFKSLNDTKSILIHIKKEPNKAISETLITQFDDGFEIKSNNQIINKSRFGKKINENYDDKDLTLQLNKITSINKKNEKGFNDFMNTTELHSSMNTASGTPSLSTFDNIDLISNIFSQTETQENIEQNSKMISFENSDDRFMEKSEQENNLNEIPILGSQMERKESKNIFKEESDDQIGSVMKENVENPKSKMSPEDKNIFKISKKKKKNSSSETLFKKKSKKNKRRTPLAVIKNQKPTMNMKSSENQPKINKSKQIRNSQNQKMSEIFMNVIKI
jgi:renal tumor antigen